MVFRHFHIRMPGTRTRALLSAFFLVWITVGLIVPSTVPVTANAAKPDVLIVIDTDAQTLTLYYDQVVKARYRVATGTRGTPSPVGVWKVQTKAVNWGTGFGTRWMGLNVPWGRFGIHGTNKPGSIGTGASHGCIRMLNKDVEALYPLVPVGTLVLIEGFRGGTIDSYAAVPGDRGAFIRHVQLRLRNHGYDPGGIDGVYGEGMKQALLRFKKDYKLGNSHVIDARTIKALGILSYE